MASGSLSQAVISEDLVVDVRAAETELGWVPHKTAVEGLGETAQWYTESIG